MLQTARMDHYKAEFYTVTCLSLTSAIILPFLSYISEINYHIAEPSLSEFEKYSLVRLTTPTRVRGPF